MAEPARLFPREHPSAQLALMLALVSIVGLGPAAGVPAMLIARLVERECFAAPGLYQCGKARFAFAIGFAGTVLYLGFGLLVLARLFPIVGYGAIGLALLALALGGVAAFGRAPTAPSSRLGAASVMALAVGAAVTFGTDGVVGLVWHAADEREEAERCEELKRRAETAAAGGDFATARRQLEQSLSTCVGDPLTEARASAAALPEREREYEKRQVTARFEQTRSKLATVLKETDTLVASKKLVEADRALRVEFDGLEGFRKYSYIASSSPWRDASKAVRDKRVQLATAVDADYRTRVTAFLTGARTLATQRRWDLALGKLTSADELRKEWQPPSTTASLWQRLSSDLERERTRVNASADAERRRKDAAAEAARKREEAIEKAKDSAAAVSRSSGNVQCCDGTTSPTCGCGRASFRGCCSHHGGICGGCD